MRSIFAAFLLIWLGNAQGALAEPPLHIANDDIEIRTNFRGTDIEIMTYLASPAENLKMVVLGPPATLTFRTKARRAGLWLNAEKILVPNAPSYIAFVGYTAAQVETACASDTLQSLAPTSQLDLGWVCDPTQRALMAGKGLYQRTEGTGTANLGNGFFSAEAFLPAAAKPGDYALRFWADGQSAETSISVQRAGLEKWVLETAQNSRLFYGFLCLIIAALAGYLTNLIFSRRA